MKLPTIAATAQATVLGMSACLLFVGCAGNSVPADQLTELQQLFPVVETPDPTESILFWSDEQKKLGFQNISLLLPTRELPASKSPYALEESADERLATLEYELENSNYSIARFMSEQQVGGLLVLQGNRVRYEAYGLENTSESLWVSFSVAKSVTSMLLGAAIRDGYIKSVDESITNYLPEMKGSAFDQSSISDVLQMASGVGWNEDYEDPNSDVSRAGGLDGLELQRYLSALPRAHAPGEVFNYSTGETNLVGALVRAAIGDSLSSYATTKIWQGFGMESDANWMLNTPDGVELGGCCISATLRDYGRIGRFALAEMRGRGERAVLPENWMADSITPSRGSSGYGYLWWLMDDTMFAALGIFGQSIFIDPQRDLVIVTHGAAQKAVSDTFGAHRLALVNAIRALY